MTITAISYADAGSQADTQIADLPLALASAAVHARDGSGQRHRRRGRSTTTRTPKWRRSRRNSLRPPRHRLRHLLPPAANRVSVFVDNDFSGTGSFAQVIAPMTYDGPAGAIVASPDGSGGKVAQFTSFQADTISDLWYKLREQRRTREEPPQRDLLPLRCRLRCQRVGGRRSQRPVQALAHALLGLEPDAGGGEHGRAGWSDGRRSGPRISTARGAWCRRSSW